MWKGTFLSLAAFSGENSILFFIFVLVFFYRVRPHIYGIISNAYRHSVFLKVSGSTSALLSPLMAKASVINGKIVSQCTLLTAEPLSRLLSFNRIV